MRKKNMKNKRPTRPTSQKPPSRTQQYNYSDGTYYNVPGSGSRPKTRQNTASTKRSSVTTRPKKRVKKKKAKFFVGRLMFLIGFIIGVIYLISIVLDTTQKPVISYQTVQTGFIDNSDVFNGLIIRDEKVVTNKDEGNMYLIAGEGDKVKKNGQIYQILDASQTSLLQQNIQSVESDIEKVQAKRQGISYYQNEIKAINHTINNNIEIYYMQSEPGNLLGTHELKKQLEYEIVKRKNIHMQDNAESLTELKEQKEVLATQLSGSEKIYKAVEPGIISYYVDGFEDKFTLDKLSNITEEDVKQKYSIKSTTGNQIIGANEPAYRMIKSNNWKIVCFMPESWAERFKPGQKHDFVLTEDSNVEFTLKVEENIPQEKNHKVIFASNEQLDIFANTRTASFKSLQYKYEGLKIPRSATTERNLIKIPAEYIISSEDGKGVMKSSGDGENTFQGLNIQYEDDQGYAHILQNVGRKEGLKLGDVITHPSKPKLLHTVTEVSTVKGVYVVNGRITQFKPVNSVAENEDHLIVRSNSVNGLKQFDQIVTNPKNIEEEQLLRNMDVKNNK